MSEWIKYVIRTIEGYVESGRMTPKEAGNFYLDFARAILSEAKDGTKSNKTE